MLLLNSERGLILWHPLHSFSAGSSGRAARSFTQRCASALFLSFLHTLHRGFGLFFRTYSGLNSVIGRTWWHLVHSMFFLGIYRKVCRNSPPWLYGLIWEDYIKYFVMLHVSSFFKMKSVNKIWFKQKGNKILSAKKCRGRDPCLVTMHKKWWYLLSKS